MELTLPNSFKKNRTGDGLMTVFHDAVYSVCRGEHGDICSCYVQIYNLLL